MVDAGHDSFDRHTAAQQEPVRVPASVPMPPRVSLPPGSRGGASRIERRGLIGVPRPCRPCGGLFTQRTADTAVAPGKIRLSWPYTAIDSWMHPSRGFSLLELLVVVAAIALLIAILIPALAQARRRANQLVCQTNLGTIAKGWHLYLAETKGRFLKSGPGLDNVQINFGGKQGLISAFQGPKPLNRLLHRPLVTSSDEATRMFRCPFDSGSGQAQPTYFDYRGSSYQMNHLLVGPPGPPGLQPKPGDPCSAVLEKVFKRVADLDAASLGNESKLLLAGDCGWYNAWEPGIPPADHIEWHRRPMWHNLTFMDGHVSFTRIRKGLYTTSDYTLIPFKVEQGEICQLQVEVEGP